MTTNKELEQIAKQVSLLNRLIELLRMQEEPKPEILEQYLLEESRVFSYRISENQDGFVLMNDRWGSFFTLEQAWNHPATQKAWSDELVKVAKELNSNKSTIDSEYLGLLKDMPLLGLLDILILDQFAGTITHRTACVLEAILNKYGRSLNEQ